MDQATEDRIKVLVDEHISKMDLVGRRFCVERHQGVKTLEDKVRALDGRLWGLIVLALVQVTGIAAILIKAGRG